LYGALSYLAQLQAEGARSWVPGFWAWCGLVALQGVYGYSRLSVLVVVGCTLLGSFLLASDWDALLLVAAFYGGSSALLLLSVHAIFLFLRVTEGARSPEK
jgi:hypothetical protein